MTLRFIHHLLFSSSCFATLSVINTLLASRTICTPARATSANTATLTSMGQISRRRARRANTTDSRLYDAIEVRLHPLRPSRAKENEGKDLKLMRVERQNLFDCTRSRSTRRSAQRKRKRSDQSTRRIKSRIKLDPNRAKIMIIPLEQSRSNRIASLPPSLHTLSSWSHVVSSSFVLVLSKSLVVNETALWFLAP